MNIVRNDSYARYFGIDCRFWKSNDFYELQTDYNSKLVMLGFKKYNDAELNNKIHKEVLIDEIESAYMVRTYCTYKGFNFFVDNFFEGKYILRPLIGAMEHFKDFPRQGYDPVYEAAENELEEIWEERTPIEGFIFDVAPIYYIKKKKNEI